MWTFQVPLPGQVWSGMRSVAPGSRDLTPIREVSVPEEAGDSASGSGEYLHHV